MVLTNDTDKEIVSVVIKQSAAEAETFGTDLLTGEDPWVAGEAVKFFGEDYEVSEVVFAKNLPITDMRLLPIYDIQMTFADLTSAVLHGVTVHETEEVQVQLDARHR